MTSIKMPAHLVSVRGEKKCSQCGKAFPGDVLPSLGKAFVLHVRADHQGPRDAFNPVGKTNEPSHKQTAPHDIPLRSA